MNILPKKRWHVRTKDNIARVRRDEAAAREEERKKQDKLEFAESEARINFLRKRSGLPEKHNDETSTEPREEEEHASITQHVNLFADFKSHVKTTNKDLEKEKYEKKIGYLTYLGQDTNEALRLKSWYEVAPTRVEVGEEREIVEKDMKTKYNQDPLTLINALLPPEPKLLVKRKIESPIAVRAKTPLDESSDSKKLKKHKKERNKHKKEKHKKHHKEYKHHKEKKKASKHRQEEDLSQKRLKLEQLRRERLRRELTEKARQEALLAPKEVNKPPPSVPATPRVVQKYNSQFNPELAKQNMN